MIQELLQICVIGLVSVIFATVVKKQCGEISILIGLGTGIIVAIFLLRLFQPILDFIEELREMSGLDPELLEPIVKCLGIGLLSQICVNVCNDSGQNTIGKAIEISGSVLCMYISLPLFRGIMSLLSTMGGTP